MRSLRGIFAPVTTPIVAESEDLDLRGFERNIQAHLAEGLDGVVICGSTGEAPLIGEDERVWLIETARPLVGPRQWLIAGCGAESTRLTIARTVAAKAAGADAVLIVAPHYYSSAMGLAELRTHYRRVVEASPLPVILYNIPKYMHFALPAELVAELALLENVIGIKDSSGSLDILGGYLAAQSESFSVITGSGSGLRAALEAGARGGILAVALFAAELALEVQRAVGAGNSQAVTAAQARLKPMADVIVAKLGVPGVKAALDLVGKVGGVPRAPLLPLDDAGRAEVAAVLS